MGLVAPCSITHCEARQGNASGSSMPAVTNKPIRMHGSAMRHPLRPCKTASERCSPCRTVAMTSGTQLRHAPLLRACTGPEDSISALVPTADEHPDLLQ